MPPSTRIPFEPAGPFVVASQELVAGEGRLKRGAPFPADGNSPQDLLALWVALQIDMAPPRTQEPVAAAAKKHYDKRR